MVDEALKALDGRFNEIYGEDGRIWGGEVLLADRLREKGEPVIHLGGGEPKSKTPLDAIVSCTAVLNSGDIKYTPPDGIPALKKAIIRYTEEYYGRAVRPENVVASCGAKQAIMAALIAILDPKDEVIFPAPYWVSYPEMVKLAGGVPVAVKPEDGTFYPTAREIADCIGSVVVEILSIGAFLYYWEAAEPEAAASMASSPHSGAAAGDAGALHAPAPLAGYLRCPNPACAAVNPAVARYCARCGGPLPDEGPPHA